MTHREVLKHPFLTNKEAKSFSKLKKNKKSKILAFGSFLLTENNAIMLSSHEMMPLDEIKEIVRSLYEETKDASPIINLNAQHLKEEQDAETMKASTCTLSSFENISLDDKESNKKSSKRKKALMMDEAIVENNIKKESEAKPTDIISKIKKKTSNGAFKRRIKFSSRTKARLN